jgi:hypothetical protein
MRKSPTSIFEVDISPEAMSDPFTTQMWHYKFDPHSVPDVPLGELKPMPGATKVYGGAMLGRDAGRRSETVKDFLDRSNIKKDQKSLIHQALEKTV